MKQLIAFWKKDLINKAIVMLVLALIFGAAGTVYMFSKIGPGTMFYAIFQITPGPGSELPTLAAPPTQPAPTQAAATLPPLYTATILVPLDTPTSEPPSPTVELPSPTAELPTSSPTVVLSVPSLTPTRFVPSSDVTACFSKSAPEKGHVLEVVDGNTVRVYIESGLTYYMRYIGIAVPRYVEYAQPFGEMAYHVNRQLVFNKDVLLFKDTSDKDDRGRLIRYVMVGDTFVNYELIRQGYATALNTPTDSSCYATFKAAEEQAKKSGLGQWDSTPTPKP